MSMAAIKFAFADMPRGRFKPYPKYKDSGAEWLGKLPEHWNSLRLTFCLQLLTDKTDRRENPIALENIEGWTGRLVPTSTEFEGDGIAFSSGDILFGKLRPYLAKVYLAEESGEAVGDFHVLHPRDNIVGRFCFHQILNEGFISIVNGSTYGAKMPRVSWDYMANMKLAVPPKEEQETIVAFIDREAALVDTLIEKQQRLIALLRERRQAVISRAVTKGLNPNALMKDSGNPWLGMVPKAWEIKKLKRVCSITTGYAFSSDDFCDEGIPVLRIGDITKEGTVDFSSAKYLPEEFAQTYQQFSVQKGDIVMAMTGATIGKVGQYAHDNPALLNQRVCVFRPQANPCKGFIWYQLNGRFYIEHVLLTALGGAQPNISDKQLLDCFVPTPPTPEEQIAIALFLDREITQIDKAVEKSQNAISLLQEHRTALIMAAVTGKIDVRQAA